MEETKQKSVAILTTFYQWDKAYSLTSVVENQLLMLVKYGYNPVLFVHDNFVGEEKVPAGVEIRKVIPRYLLVDYSGNQPVESSFKDQIEDTRKVLEKELKNIDIVFTHDWIFQGWFLNYNVAMREAAKNLNCRWLHWVHSAPSLRPIDIEYPHNLRYLPMPNSKLVYMNNVDVLRLIEMYGGDHDSVRVVHNPLDPRSFFNYHPFVHKLIDKYRLLEADVIDVYPVSSTRYDGKQVHKVIRLLSEIKKRGRSVRFICPNAHANGEAEKQKTQEMIDYGIELGLTREELVFTSFEGEEWEQGVPHEIVRDLFSLSNLFVFPTISENGPLIMLEAAMSKALIVANDSFPPLRDFFQEDALYFTFGSLIFDVNYADEGKWYQDLAIIVIAELMKNKPLNAFAKVKQRFNNDYIFKNELEPLFFEQWN